MPRRKPGDMPLWHGEPHPIMALDVKTVAALLGISVTTVKAAIKHECENNHPEETRAIPGGRHFEDTYWVLRQPFEAVVGRVGIDE